MRREVKRSEKWPFQTTSLRKSGCPNGFGKGIAAKQPETLRTVQPRDPGQLNDRSVWIDPRNEPVMVERARIARADIGDEIDILDRVVNDRFRRAEAGDRQRVGGSDGREQSDGHERSCVYEECFVRHSVPPFERFCLLW